MMQGNVSATLRPRPPAQQRRASATVKASPPPPYAATFPSKQPTPGPISPLGRSRHNSNISFDASLLMGDRSRDGLAELLNMADELLKGREDELDQTAVACKQLYHSNLALKSKHQELLARFPTVSPVHTPLGSPTPSMTSLHQIQHRSSGLPLSSSDTSFRRRRISISPADIAALSDQNAELLEKIEALESENVHVVRDGCRQMDKLDSEIHYLRAELEKMQAKSEELEERAIKGEREIKRMERDERWREIRSASARSRQEDAPPIKDFAPESIQSAMRRSSNTRPNLNISPSSTSHNVETPNPLPPANTPVDLHRVAEDVLPEMDEEELHFPDNNAESVLISQLLSKIQELEETNVRMYEQQAGTAAKLRAVQEETESISRAYECLDNDDEIEVVVEGSDPFLDDDTTQRQNPAQTIRFSSLRRNIALERSLSLPFPSEDDFSKDIQNAAQSTIRSSSSQLFNRDSRTSSQLSHKVRKSVVGLFGSSSAGHTPSDGQKQFAFPTSDNSFLTDGAPPSPALSALSVTSNNPFLNLNDGARTLENELGEDWSSHMARSDGHRHTASIYDMLSLPPSVAGSPTRSTSAFLSDETQTPASDQQLMPPNNNLRISLQPPTPEKFRDHPEEVASATIGRGSVRYRKMSQSLRMRSGRWADGRFKEMLPVGKEPTQQKDELQDIKSVPVPASLAKVLESVNEALGPQEATPSTVAQGSQRKRDRLAALMFELWLWLQFFVIIAVFLVATAKRGPRAVLKERQGASQRK